MKIINAQPNAKCAVVLQPKNIFSMVAKFNKTSMKWKILYELIFYVYGPTTCESAVS